MMNLEAWFQNGGFWEDLFIDLVDFEYCLRAKRCGLRILVSPAAKLEHRLGSRRRVSLFGIRVTALFHSPQRVYYIWRNRIAVLKRHALAVPHWLLYELVSTPVWALRILALEPRRWSKAMAMVWGTIDGLLGRLGPISETRILEIGDTRVNPTSLGQLSRRVERS
jgi:rhamnosyltransferase